MIGSRTRAKVVKNKIAPPFREAEFDVMYGQGISHEGEILDLAVKLDIIQKSGSWFAFGEKKLAQGRDKTKEYLRANPEFTQNLEEQIRSSANTIYAKPSMARNTEANTEEIEEKESE